MRNDSAHLLSDRRACERVVIRIWSDPDPQSTMILMINENEKKGKN